MRREPRLCMRSTRASGARRRSATPACSPCVAVVFGALFALGLDERVAPRGRPGACAPSSAARTAATRRDHGRHAEEPYEDTGRAEREVYDADCDNSLPGDRVARGRRRPDRRRRGRRGLGEPRAHLRLLPRHASAATPTTTAARELIATVHFCETPGEHVRQRVLERRPDGLRRGLRRRRWTSRRTSSRTRSPTARRISSTSASPARSTSPSRTSSPPTSTPDDWEIGEDLPNGADPRHVRSRRGSATRRTSTTTTPRPTTATPPTTTAPCTPTPGSRTTPTT